jgi:hypothetical protein
MNFHKRPFVATACLATSLLFSAQAFSQEGGEGEGKEFPFRYAAHFVCGTPEKGSGGQLTFGKYATQINMQNWHGKRVKLRKKVALTYPPRAEQQGMASPWIGPEKIKPNHALSVDCEEIVGSGRLSSEFFVALPTLEDGTEATFYTGYVIIQSNRSLNVTTVHTAGPRPGKGGEGDEVSASDGHDGGEDGKDKQPQVHTISVTNVPEHVRAEFRQHDEEDGE